MTQGEYEEAFPGVQLGKQGDMSARKVALDNALDIRKFEIQLYWTRAAYFWAFTSAALGAYGAVQTIGDYGSRLGLSTFVCSIGLVFAFAWYFANRGSKQWQENWEQHVDLLETEVHGPLYKVVLRRSRPKTFSGRAERMLVGPGEYSVSKINQIVSVYICAVWLMLLCFGLVRSASALTLFPFAKQVSPVVLAIAAILLMVRSGRTDQADSATIATRRNTVLEDPVSFKPSE